MNNITILKSTPIYFPSFKIALLIFTIFALIVFSTCHYEGKKYGRTKYSHFLTLILVGYGIGLLYVVGCLRTLPILTYKTDNYEYVVIPSNDVIEFYNTYNIINVDGNEFTVRLK